MIKINTPEFRKQFEKIQNGEFLAVHRTNNGNWRRIHLKKIFFKPYELNYRTTKTKNGKGRIGKELMISNFPLPKGRVV